MTSSPAILEVEMTEFPYRLHVGYERKTIRDDFKDFGWRNCKMELSFTGIEKTTKASLERVGLGIPL